MFEDIKHDLTDPWRRYGYTWALTLAVVTAVEIWLCPWPFNVILPPVSAFLAGIFMGGISLDKSLDKTLRK